MKMFFNFLLSQLLFLKSTTFNYRSLPSMRRVNTKFLHLKMGNDIDNELLRCKSSINPFDLAKIPYLEEKRRQFEAARKESRREAEEARREAEEARREAEEARREAEEARREAEEARRENEEARRENEEARREAEEARFDSRTKMASYRSQP